MPGVTIRVGFKTSKRWNLWAAKTPARWWQEEAGRGRAGARGDRGDAG